MAEPMADPVVIAEEDLEDGEIESDGEDAPEVQTERINQEALLEPEPEPEPEEKVCEQRPQEPFYSKPGKKKKSKSKGDQKFKDKNKKNRKFPPPEDDFAGNIEKAIRKAMNKSDDRDDHSEGIGEDRRRYKKRKKNENKDGPGKKRKKQEYSDEMDESEMMCVRGASPVQKSSTGDGYPDDDKDSYASDSSTDSRNHDQHHRQQRQRPQQRERSKKKNSNDWRRGPHPMQDPDGVCLYFMQGKCHKGDDCIYSHDAEPPRKMELCKFYLMECCAKRDKCLYMHSDFPCKYYHTGLPCIYKDECKFAHGKPLTESLKNILLKHIESAPKEILGDFPRLNREGALKMMQTTQAKLMQQFSDNLDSQDKPIPSLFELNIPNPQNSHDNSQIHQFGNDRQPKVSPKVRQSRWQNDNNQNFNTNLLPGGNASSSNVLSIKNLTGVLSPRQILDLSTMGIETLDQLGQLTVLQLNSFGISFKQINEIQINTMSIQKLGLISSESQPPALLPTPTGPKDMDLRVPPPAVTNSNNVHITSGLPGQDIDMRFQPAAKPSNSEEKVIKNELQQSKDMIDIDQYTKDALKFASKDKENIDVSNETFDNDSKPLLPDETKDVDHRVLPFTDESTKLLHNISLGSSVKKEYDTDIRFLRPEPIFKSADKRQRRSTTDDDEESNLLIDEKWYSSDEEKGMKKKSPVSSPQPASSSPQQLVPPIIEPSSFISKLGDLSKIDISAEVTKLLNNMKNNLHENKVEIVSDPNDPRKSRDPRAKRSPEKNIETTKVFNKKPTRISIYECIEGEPTDGRRRSDVDLRKSDFPGFGDTDLRQASTSSGDIDLRLSLPFKAIPNYTPASEIDGSINSHPPIQYKLLPIDIPRPDYTDIRNSTAKSQALLDPRLRKVFRLSVDESNSDSEKPTKQTPTGPRVDPRRKLAETVENNTQEQKSNSMELQTILQNSNWFKDLSSTQKISVNQNLMPVMQMIKQYHQEKSSGKKFDLTPIQSNNILCTIFANLGVILGENGEFSYIPKPKEGLLKTPISFSPTGNPFGMNSGVIDANSMNIMNMPPINVGGLGGVGSMNNMNVGPIHGFNQSMADLRGGPTPGLLGIAPNIPHNFNAFGPNNFGNMGFNGPNPTNYMDGDQNYQRFPNRAGSRGRGNERWNRGGSGGGHRKNYNDRGKWKNDRH